MIGDRDNDAGRNELYNRWQEWTYLQRKVVLFLFWIEMQKRNKFFWLFLTTALTAVVSWGIWEDPIVLAIGVLVGLVLGIVITPLR